MNNFDYVRPTTISEAIAAASEPGAAYLAAGTNLVDLMKGGIARPARLVDINRIAGLDRIEPLADGAVRIGALVRNADLAHDADFARRFPAVAEALLSGASAQLRNAATVGGNLCSARAAPISTTSRAPATNARRARAATRAAATTACTPCSAGARAASRPILRISAYPSSRSTRSSRSRARRAGAKFLSRIFIGCPATRRSATARSNRGELIVAVRLPAEAAGFSARSRYLKVRERTSYAFAVASAAAVLRIEGGLVARARIALGGVAMKPWRARAAEQILVGAEPADAVFRRAAEAALADARPSGDNAFKIELARRIVTRALTLAAAGRPSASPRFPLLLSPHRPEVFMSEIAHAPAHVGMARISASR